MSQQIHNLFHRITPILLTRNVPCDSIIFLEDNFEFPFEKFAKFILSKKIRVCCILGNHSLWILLEDRQFMPHEREGKGEIFVISTFLNEVIDKFIMREATSKGALSFMIYFLKQLQELSPASA